MKKIFLILCSLSFLFASVYAQECSKTCKIADSPAPALTEYFTNIETVSSNILDALSTASSEWEDENTKRSIKSERNGIIASLNSLLSFWNHFSSFDFNISLPITNEVPTEVKRDHTRLQKETEKLSQVLQRSEKRNIAWKIVPNICSGVSNCSFSENMSARNILVEIIGNNEKITELYRGSILDKAYGTLDDTYILVSDDFRGQIEEYYNKDTLTDCSSCEGWFADRIREAIKNIGSLNTNAREWIQNWKDAWALMRWWKAAPWYAEQEAKLLADYLDTQWISSEQADVVTDNLERYSSGALTSSNPLFNSSNYSLNNTENELKTFEEVLREKFAENGEDKVPNAEITRVEVGLKESEDIKKSIKTLYEEQLPAAQVQDTTTQNLQARIIRMHFSLIRSIKYMEDNIRSAEKVCDKAGPKWRCRY